MRLYYEAIEQRVSTVKGPFYIGFLCIKMTCLLVPESQIRMRTTIITFDLIEHRDIDGSQKVDTTVKQAHAVIDSLGGIWTKEVVVWRRARLTRKNRTTRLHIIVVAAPGNMKCYYQHHQ
jgi:hypothetical protein